MKRTMSLLLAAIMLLGFLPATAVPVSAAESVQIEANYTPYVITIDGLLNENQWILRDRIGSAEATFLCDQQKLYVGLRTEAFSADLTLNGVAVAVDFSAGTVVVNNDKVGTALHNVTKGTAEFELPLSTVGLSYAPNQPVDFSMTLGNASLSGKLILASCAVVVSENFDDIASRPFGSKLNKDTSEIYAVQGEGGIHFKTGPLSEKGSELNGVSWPIADLDANQGYEITFTADFNDLPVANQLGYLAISGFFIDIRTTEYCRHGFFADKDGSLMVSLYDEPADLTRKFDTGLDLPAKDVDVRIVVNDDYTSEVFINGKSVANFPCPTRKATGTTIILGTTTLRRDTSVNNGSDVQVYDFLITQRAPQPSLTVNQVANPADLTMDGNADEMFWTLNAGVGNTKLGALCDEKNLYLALDTTESAVEFNLNGMKATAKLGSKPTFALGYTTGSAIKGNGKGQYEIAIPLHLLHVDKPTGQQLPFSITSGKDVRQYAMTIGGGIKLELLTRDPADGDGKNDAIAYLDVAQLTRDGKLKENQWYVPYPLAGAAGTPAAGVGFLWDAYNLYVGGQLFSSGKPSSMELTVNGKTITADFGTGTSSVGALLLDGQTFEWCLPLKDLNMTAPLNTSTTYELKMTNAKGTSNLYGKLDIVGKSVVWGDSCDDFLTKSYIPSKAKYTTWNQGVGEYVISTDPALGTANDIYEFYTPLDFEGGAYEFTLDMNIKNIGNYTATLGWRGITWEIRQPKLQTRFNFRQDGNGNIIMDILYYLHYESANTGVKLGERATYTIKVDENRIPSLYVNGKFVQAFSTLNREQFTISANDTKPMPRLIIDAQNHGRALNADGSLSSANAVIYDMLWTQQPYNSTEAVLDAALAQLKDEDILAGSDATDTLQLRLPKTVTVSDIGTVVDVKWSAIDTATGQKFNAIDLNTGTITRGDRPVVFDLTAEVSFGGKGATKTFTFQTQGKPSASKVAMIPYDTNPFVGQVSDWNDNRYDYFDTNQNSLVMDQGSSKPFNRIVLHDGDNISRVAQRHLGVFISEDGKEWTKVTGWLLHQGGKDYTLYNLNEKARFVKVHTYHDDYAMREYQPSFYNVIPEMLSVSNEPYLPGANGAFAHKAEFVAKNTTAAEQKDTPVFISLADLGAQAGQYKADGADFRFTIGTTTLAHWYNGKDGFYVRVPSIPANGSTTITAQWGCSSAKDFSDGEAVFEVTYGNVTLLPLFEQTGIFTHGRPIVLSNGDVIVVGRRADTKGDLAFVRSTDGGYTFNKTPEVVIYDADYPGRALGYGGFIYNEKIDRLYLLAYSGNGKDANDYRIVMSYTDDCGYTWSDPVYLRGAHVEPIQSTDVVIQGYPEYFSRVCFYGDGLTLSTYDGDGPNVDYVFSSEDSDRRTSQFKAFVMYSCDDGKSWTMSPDIFEIPVDHSRNAEDGVSETTLSELSNGDLYLVVRTQQEGNFYLWSGISKDHGKTWTQGYSKILSSNTSPCMYRYDDTRLLLWSAMTGLGGVSYRRTPMHLAVTTDDFQSFDKVIDLTFGTSFDTVHEQESRMTQPGIAVYDDGNSAFVAYFDHMWKLRTTVTLPGVAGWRGNGTGTVGFKIDEFEDMLYGNKGAYDNFETALLKYQGWLCDLGHVIEISDEASVSGMYSMKVVDALGAGTPAHALRQVPSMKSGTVGAKLMAPAANKADFVMELKAAYNYTHMQHTLAAFALSPDGTVSLCSDEGKTAVTKVQPGTWNDFAISFDIASGMGKLYVNGKVVSDITLETDETMYPHEMGKPVEYHQEDVVREITCVQFNQAEATPDMGDCLYVDDFYATELTSALDRTIYNIAFDDVKQGDWYFDAVNFAVENGIMSGYNASQFGPNDTLTRAMVVQVLYNKEGQPALNGLKHSFSDVPASQWFNNAVTWGSNRGVVSGFGGGVFKPEDAVTIEQVAVILWNYSNTPTGYGDLKEVGGHSDWAANALRWAVEQGILENVPFTNATEQATRAQTAQMLTNYLRNI